VTTLRRPCRVDSIEPSTFPLGAAQGGAIALCLCAVLIAWGTTAQAAMVRTVRQITTPGSTRLVIELTGTASYRLVPIAARRAIGSPERLYVEILDSQVDPRLATFGLSEGPVVRVRATQASKRVARLILDAPGMTEYGAFWMADPFRLIVDVRGPQRQRQRPSPTMVATPRPPPRRGAVSGTTPEVAPSPKPTSTPRRRFRILIDPGHGGKDTGAIGVTGVAEKDIVLAIALLLKSRLAASSEIDVVLTRQTDVFLQLEERTARANAEQADLFLSIHANASTNTEANGVETYYLNNTADRATLRLAAMENGLRHALGQEMKSDSVSLILSDLIQNFKIQESVRLAEVVQRSVITELDARGTPSRDLGVKRGPFYVLVGAAMPCVLVEVSFVTHATEGVRLTQRSYQEAIADGLLRAIRQFVEYASTTGNL